MKNTYVLFFSLFCLFSFQSAQAQLPASPWDTQEFDDAIYAKQEKSRLSSARRAKSLPADEIAPTFNNTAYAGTSSHVTTGNAKVAHIKKNNIRKANIPSIKYAPVNADAKAPVYVSFSEKYKTSGKYKPTQDLTRNSSVETPTTQAKAGAQPWRGSGQYGKLDYTGEVTTYTNAYGQEMLAPEVNNNNMNVMVQHLRNLGYKIPQEYDNKFGDFVKNYSKDLHKAYDGLGHQKNPFDTMFSGILDVFEDQSGLDLENILFNSVDLVVKD